MGFGMIKGVVAPSLAFFLCVSAACHGSCDYEPGVGDGREISSDCEIESDLYKLSVDWDGGEIKLTLKKLPKTGSWTIWDYNGKRVLYVLRSIELDADGTTYYGSWTQQEYASSLWDFILDKYRQIPDVPDVVTPLGLIGSAMVVDGFDPVRDRLFLQMISIAGKETEVVVRHYETRSGGKGKTYYSTAIADHNDKHAVKRVVCVGNGWHGPFLADYGVGIRGD